MKTCSVSIIESLNSTDFKTCIDLICRLKNLRELKLTFAVKEPIDKSLSLIGRECRKLMKLDLFIDPLVPISDTFFDVFAEFKAIKKLYIHLPDDIVLSGSVECFKHCTELYELKIFWAQIRKEFFTDIELFMPRLQYLVIHGNNGVLPYAADYEESFIELFHSMKFIQKSFHNFISPNFDYAFINFFGKGIKNNLYLYKVNNYKKYKNCIYYRSIIENFNT